MIKIVTLATLLGFAATSSFAGSLNQAAEEDEPVAFVPVGGSGIGAPAIVGGVIAAVAVAALIANDDDDDGSVSNHPDPTD